MTPDPEPRPPRPRRRWLRLSLRASMVAVLVVGGAAGWLAHTIRTQRQAVTAVKAAGGSVSFDWQREQVGTGPTGRPVYRKEPAAPAWLRRWLGDELFQAVRSVSFPGRATPEALAALGQFARLEEVRLGDSTGVGDGLRHLRDLRQLKTVWIAGPGVTDAMLADLAGCPGLRTLVVGRSPTTTSRPTPDPKASPTDAGFALLARSASLETLEVEACPNLTDAGLAGLLAGLPRLKSLYLTGGPPTLAAALPALVLHHPDLDMLGLRTTGVTNADLKLVAGLARLRSIDLGGTGVTDAGIARLRPLRNMISVSLSNTAVTDASLAVVSEWPEVWQLSASKTKISDAGLEHLARLPRLRTLFLGWNDLTDAGMPALGRIATLERLSLDQAPGLTDAGLDSLRGLGHLRELMITQTQVTPEGVAALRAAVPSLTRVTTRAPRPVPPKPTGAKP